MNSKEYFRQVQDAALAAPHVIQSHLFFDEISENDCYIRGYLVLIGELQLHIAEYVITEPTVQRLKYRYHLQTTQDKFVSRWDNAPHHPEIEKHPHHWHLKKSVRSSPAMSIERVLTAVLPFLPNK